jgi:hypothetical protein
MVSTALASLATSRGLGRCSVFVGREASSILSVEIYVSTLIYYGLSYFLFQGLSWRWIPAVPSSSPWTLPPCTATDRWVTSTHVWKYSFKRQKRAPNTETSVNEMLNYRTCRITWSCCSVRWRWRPRSLRSLPRSFSTPSDSVRPGPFPGKWAMAWNYKNIIFQEQCLMRTKILTISNIKCRFPCFKFNLF